MMTSIEESINILSSFLHNEYDVEVRLEESADNAYFPSIAVVEIDSSMGLEERYHTLLHEASHVILHPNTSEEHAWLFAEQVVESLNLHSLTENFLRLKKESIQSYLNNKLQEKTHEG